MIIFIISIHIIMKRTRQSLNSALRGVGTVGSSAPPVFRETKDSLLTRKVLVTPAVDQDVFAINEVDDSFSFNTKCDDNLANQTKWRYGQKSSQLIQSNYVTYTVAPEAHEKVLWSDIFFLMDFAYGIGSETSQTSPVPWYVLCNTKQATAEQRRQIPLNPSMYYGDNCPWEKLIKNMEIRINDTIIYKLLDGFVLPQTLSQVVKKLPWMEDLSASHIEEYALASTNPFNTPIQPTNLEWNFLGHGMTNDTKTHRWMIRPPVNLFFQNQAVPKDIKITILVQWNLQGAVKPNDVEFFQQGRNLMKQLPVDQDLQTINKIFKQEGACKTYLQKLADNLESLSHVDCIPIATKSDGVLSMVLTECDIIYYSFKESSNQLRKRKKLQDYQNSGDGNSPFFRLLFWNTSTNITKVALPPSSIAPLWNEWFITGGADDLTEPNNKGLELTLTANVQGTIAPFYYLFASANVCMGPLQTRMFFFDSENAQQIKRGYVRVQLANFIPILPVFIEINGKRIYFQEETNSEVIKNNFQHYYDRYQQSVHGYLASRTIGESRTIKKWDDTCYVGKSRSRTNDNDTLVFPSQFQDVTNIPQLQSGQFQIGVILGPVKTINHANLMDHVQTPNDFEDNQIDAFMAATNDYYANPSILSGSGTGRGQSNPDSVLTNIVTHRLKTASEVLWPDVGDLTVWCVPYTHTAINVSGNDINISNVDTLRTLITPEVAIASTTSTDSGTNRRPF